MATIPFLHKGPHATPLCYWLDIVLLTVKKVKAWSAIQWIWIVVPLWLSCCRVLTYSMTSDAESFAALKERRQFKSYSFSFKKYLSYLVTNSFTVWQVMSTSHYTVWYHACHRKSKCGSFPDYAQTFKVHLLYHIEWNTRCCLQVKSTTISHLTKLQLQNKVHGVVFK